MSARRKVAIRHALAEVGIEVRPGLDGLDSGTPVELRLASEAGAAAPPPAEAHPPGEAVDVARAWSQALRRADEDARARAAALREELEAARGELAAARRAQTDAEAARAAAAAARERASAAEERAGAGEAAAAEQARRAGQLESDLAMLRESHRQVTELLTKRDRAISEGAARERAAASAVAQGRERAGRLEAQLADERRARARTAEEAEDLERRRAQAVLRSDTLAAELDAARAAAAAHEAGLADTRGELEEARGELGRARDAARLAETLVEELERELEEVRAELAGTTEALTAAEAEANPGGGRGRAADRGAAPDARGRAGARAVRRGGAAPRPRGRRGRAEHRARARPRGRRARGPGGASRREERSGRRRRRWRPRRWPGSGRRRGLAAESRAPPLVDRRPRGAARGLTPSSSGVRPSSKGSADEALERGTALAAELRETRAAAEEAAREAARPPRRRAPAPRRGPPRRTSGPSASRGRCGPRRSRPPSTASAPRGCVTSWRACTRSTARRRIAWRRARRSSRRRAPARRPRRRARVPGGAPGLGERLPPLPSPFRSPATATLDSLDCCSAQEDRGGERRKARGSEMLSRARSHWMVIAGTALAFALLPAGTALAAAPTVVTGGAALVNSSSATLTGTVNPQGLATRYYFQWGATAAYGARTPSTSAGAGKAGVPAVADLTGLTPATRYHYRLVAHNAGGTRVGADRSFVTARQPLALVIGAQPNPVPFGGGTLIAGTLTGTGNGGRQVVLQQNAFPYTTGFQSVGNPQVTNAAGGFSFPLLSIPINTQYRVTTLTTPPVISPPIGVGVAVR